MSRLLDPDEVPDDLVHLIDTLLDLVASKDPGVELVKWYHDMPIWLIKEPHRVIQIDLELSAGRLRINCTERPQ